MRTVLPDSRLLYHARAPSLAKNMLTEKETTMKITLPQEIEDEICASDCARIIVAPPTSVAPPEWRAWAKSTFSGYPVARTDRIVENGRLLLAIWLGKLPKNEPVETFRFPLPPTDPPPQNNRMLKRNASAYESLKSKSASLKRALPEGKFERV